MAGGQLPFGLAPSGSLTNYKPTLTERVTDTVRRYNPFFTDDRAGQQKAERVTQALQIPFGFATDMYDAGREAGRGNFGAAGLALGMAGIPGPTPKGVPKIVKSDPRPADYIEQGSIMLRYEDPDTGAFMDIVTRPKGVRSASVIGLEVPEEFRGRGIGKALQAAVLADFPSMMGQVSSKAAAVNAYKAGRRMLSNPNATLEEIFKAIDDDSSVNLATFTD